MSTTSVVIITVIAYLFLFELSLSLKWIPFTEEKLPLPLQWQHRGWEKFSHVLGIIMSKIILTILWIIGFGPYAVIWRLGHRRKKRENTYWVAISSENTSMKYSF